MRLSPKLATATALWVFALVLLTGGCSWFGRCQQRTPTPPLGTHSDPIWRRQVASAAASQFVVYEHEFEKDGVRLNVGGEDHVKSIAAKLHAGISMPVVVERSMSSVRPDSKYEYPVNPSPELDMKRRDVVVGSLVALGIPNADQCVSVAPAMAEGYTATEAVRAYNRGLTQGAFGQGQAAGFGTASVGSAGFSGGGSL